MPSRESGAIGAVYAQALFDVASGEGIVEQIEQELRVVCELAHRDAAVRRFLETPTVSVQQKAKVLRAALKDFHAVLLNFLIVGIQNGRVPGVLPRVVEHYHELWRRHAGIAELNLRSARKLDQDELGRLKEVMEQKLGRKVVLSEALDAKLLGGFVLEHGDTQWDTSVARRLNEMIERIKAVKFTGELLAKEA